MSDRNKNGVSRRETLGYIGAGAMTVGAAAGTVSADDTVEIVYSVDTDGPVRTKTVPKTWNNHRKHVDQTLQQVNKKIS